MCESLVLVLDGGSVYVLGPLINLAAVAARSG